MRPAGLQAALHDRHEAEALQHAVMRNGMFAFLGVVVHLETQAVGRIAPDVGIDRAFVLLDIAPDHGYVKPVYAMHEELAGEVQLRLVILGHHQQS